MFALSISLAQSVRVVAVAASRTLQIVAACCVFSVLAGCQLNAYTNVQRREVVAVDAKATTEKCTDASRCPAPEPADPCAKPGKARASLQVDASRGKAADTLFVLALSGGGSRAAYFSAQSMLAMSSVFEGAPDLLREVDAISAVSGGALPAAYYAISADVPAEGTPIFSEVRPWNERVVPPLMKRNFLVRSFGNWFWPTNIAKYWFTAYDRTDIMAQTLADNLFDNPVTTFDYKMRDLRCDRPYLILNATINTRDAHEFPDQLFTFTEEDFARLDSSIGDYDLGRAVMASAAFPAVFQSMTLRDFSGKNDKSYLHLFDGGNFDNLGLSSISRMLTDTKEGRVTFKRLVVILIDAYTGTHGAERKRYDPRSLVDRFLDTNFIDATDSLLSTNRNSKIDNLRQKITEAIREGRVNKDAALFYHVSFDDIAEGVTVPDKSGKPIGLRHALKRISTNFLISDDNARFIDAAVARIFQKDNRCLRAIRGILEDGKHGEPDVDVYCKADRL